MAVHAKNSPSGASGWMRCAGWASDTAGSEFADEGTAAHELASTALGDGQAATDYLGQVISVGERQFTVDAEMAGHVQSYVDLVRSIPGELMVEQRLPIDHLTGEHGAAGTSDAVILAGDELVIVDLKYGRGVRVDAERNEQLMIYALAALNVFDVVGDIGSVRLVICQPRLSHVSEWVVPVAELRAFAREVRAAADRRQEGSTDLAPGEKQCRWCAKKATCGALRDSVLSTVAAEFDDVSDLTDARAVVARIKTAVESVPESDPAVTGSLMSAIEMIETWCKAVRAHAESLLLAGTEVPGWKLVEGRRGARKWADEAQAEEMLRAFRVKHDQMYEYRLISPPTAEKLAKAEVIGKRQWPRLAALITQADGKPSVAPASDKRPALVVQQATADDFEDAAPTAGAPTESAEDLV
jgi:hypothetical protein